MIQVGDGHTEDGTVNSQEMRRRSIIRRLTGRVTAVVFLIITRRRMRGGTYILQLPSTVRIASTSSVVVGENVMISDHARIVALGGNIHIGDDVFIGKNSTIVAFADLSIGARTLIGQNCSLHTENHGPVGARDRYSFAPILIGDDVWLGAGVVVTSGCQIAGRITIGANSVVTGDLLVPGLYAGSPARLIRAE